MMLDISDEARSNAKISPKFALYYKTVRPHVGLDLLNIF